ncbi:zinc ribbon domain-containing protein [Cohnella abietis]|uniref:Uncharacterized protein n=1 Tax=Cohnella abietis TaxID=2507935 RepID=A0A3T1D6Q5_9BACL|nr:zinc ribbon domain-containing protein [Cohnella abietis]BBI33768.1 hypothetical protein KCTCHS21_31670 [Cohnella abietis]
MGFIVWLILTSLSLFIFYSLIKSAINNSKQTETLNNIKDILIDIRENQKNRVVVEESAIEMGVGNEEEAITVEECPGCQQTVASNATNCPTCGLRLRD